MSSSTGVSRIRTNETRTAEGLLAEQTAQIESEKIFVETNEISGINGPGIANQGTAAGNYLSRAGDLRGGPMGNEFSIVEIINDEIDVGITSGQYTPFVIVNPEGGSDDILDNIIPGTSPFFNQELILQAGNLASSVTIRENLASDAPILTPGSADVVLNFGDLVGLIFSQAVLAWIVCWTSVGSGANPFPILYPKEDLTPAIAFNQTIDLSIETGNAKQIQFPAGDIGLQIIGDPANTVAEDVYVMFIQDGVGGRSLSTVDSAIKNGSLMDTLLDKNANAKTTFRLSTLDGGVSYHAILVDLTTSAGDVVGPGSSTDNAIARFDGITGKIIQNSGIIINDSDEITGVTLLTMSGDIDVNGNSVNNILSLDIEDSIGNTQLAISGPLGVGGRLQFALGNGLFFTENITDIVSIDASGMNLLSHDITMGTGGDIQAGGAGVGMTFIGHLDFLDNLATPIATFSIFSDGTDLFGNTGSHTTNFDNLPELTITNTFTAVNTFDENIIAGGAGDGMTNIGHLDFVDNLATPVAPLSIYSDGTFLIANTNSGAGNLFVTPALEDLDMDNFNIKSTATPTIGDQFRIIFDAHDDSDTFISNTVTVDLIHFESNGIGILDISPTGLLLGATIDMNNENIENVGNMDFGPFSATSGRIRLPAGGGGAIKWESVPAGFDGEMYFDNDFNWFVDTGGTYKYFEGGFERFRVGSSVDFFDGFADMSERATPANPAANERRIFVNSATQELSVRTNAGTTISLEAGGTIPNPLQVDGILATLPQLILNRTDTTADNQDVGLITFQALDDSATPHTWAEIRGTISDNNDTDAEGELEFYVSTDTADDLELFVRMEGDSAGGGHRIEFFKPLDISADGMVSGFDITGVGLNTINATGTGGSLTFNANTGGTVEFQVATVSKIFVSATTISITNPLDVNVNTISAIGTLDFEDGHSISGNPGGLTINLSSADTFTLQDNGVTFATFTDDTARLISVDNGTLGYRLRLGLDSTTPADNDTLSIIPFVGRDTSGNETTFAQITARATDVTNGTEDGELAFEIIRNAIRATGLRLVASAGNTAIAFFGDPTGATQQTVTGAKGGNAALASLLTALEDYGLIIDNTT